MKRKYIEQRNQRSSRKKNAYGIGIDWENRMRASRATARGDQKIDCEWFERKYYCLT